MARRVDASLTMSPVSVIYKYIKREKKSKNRNPSSQQSSLEGNKRRNTTMLLLASASVLLSLLVLLQQQHSVDSHARLECPPPLSPKTGAKAGPCDSKSDDFRLAAYPLIPNAFNTITWLESISHPGAPSRFALSNEVVVGAASGEDGDNDNGNGNDNNDDAATMHGFESCILLDHVPHDARSLPNYQNQASWHRSSITLWIPDVYCERCYLQLISVMSDAQHGVPADTKCSYHGAAVEKANDTIGVDSEHPPCPAVYHSCSPVSIQGTVPRNEIAVCNTTDYETKLDWPLTARNNPDLYQHSVYYNRGDVGLYTETDARLTSIGVPITDETCTNPLYCDPDIAFDVVQTVPDNAPYTSLVGTCAAMTGMVVEPYQPNGVLPSVPKEEGEEGVEVTVENIELDDDDDEKGKNLAVDNTTSLIVNDDENVMVGANGTDSDTTSASNHNRGMLTLLVINSITAMILIMSPFLIMEN